MAIALVVAMALAAPAALGSPAPPAQTAAALDALAAPENELDVERSAIAGGSTVLRVEQEVGGHPVLGGESVLVREPDGSVTQIADDTVAGLDVPDAPLVGREEALATAAADLGDPELRFEPSAELVVDPASGELVWRAVLPTVEPFADRELLVSAADATILARRNLIQGFTGRAKLHRDNPISQQRSYKGLSDRGDENYKRLNRQRRPVELPRMHGRRGCLRGEAVVVRAGQSQRSICRRSRDWRQTKRASQSFEPLMAYFHVNRAEAYLASLDLSGPIFDAPQRVNANGIDVDNSYFSPSNDQITLGRGGVDDGEDGEIIVHEYGHAVQDAQAPGFGRTSQGAAMGEGFGDYLAATVGERFSRLPTRFDVCVGEWDSTSYQAKPSCLRKVDSNLRLRKAQRRCGGDPHCIGLPWSAALWDLRAALGEDSEGRMITDRVVVDSHFLMTSRSGFREGVRAMIAVDESLYAGEHVAQIEGEMESRGFCPSAGC
ncbi:hypothetical protein HJD18_07810 [Thermoleophilia bacterium SCSIO 60948]|nr:hypothetical protein HJD18_07810 [Thermoleophilia bacterium SCSIO 60948]